jgi:hypothetical protein
MYDKIGFTFTGFLKPDYEYVINNKRLHKFNFRHATLSKILPTYSLKLSERQNTEIAGIDRIWNCGLKRYVMIK